MEYHCCDMCGEMLKHERHVVVIVHDKEFASGKKQYNQQQPRRTFEVCDNCMTLIEKIFSYKKGKLKKIKDWLDKTYNLPTKEIKDGK